MRLCRAAGDSGKDQDRWIDEEGMRDRWARCQQAAGVKDGDTWKKRKRILLEAATRDPHWLLTGEPTPIDYSRAPISEYGILRHRSKEFNPADYEESNVMDRGGEWRDLFAHDALSSNGFRIATRPSKAVGANGKVMDGVTTPDIEIDGVMWEIKSVRNGSHSKKNELSFIEQTIRDARKNFRNPYDEAKLKGRGDMTSQTKLVLNTRYRSISASHEQVVRELSRQSKKYSTEVIWIDDGGSILRFVP